MLLSQISLRSEISLAVVGIAAASNRRSRRAIKA